MALAVVYTTINGQIVHENRGGVERAYLPDTLGSTAALLDSSQNKTDEWRYWPYGEVASRTGSNVTPFTFVGTLGYFKDMLDKLFYVRARHYQPHLTRWLTVDPIWDGLAPTWLTENFYAYTRLQPTTWVDPGGLETCDQQNPCSLDGSLRGACIALLCSFGTVKDLIDDLKGGIGMTDKGLEDILKWLKKMKGKQYSPEHCCAKAHGNPKGPGLKIGLWPPISYVPPELAWIVKQVCARIEKSNSPCFFVCRSTGPADCYKKCGTFPGVIRDKCRQACDLTDWEDGKVVGSQQCVCRGAIRG